MATGINTLQSFLRSVLKSMADADVIIKSASWNFTVLQFQWNIVSFEDKNYYFDQKPVIMRKISAGRLLKEFPNNLKTQLI